MSGEISGSITLADYDRLGPGQCPKYARRLIAEAMNHGWTVITRGPFVQTNVVREPGRGVYRTREILVYRVSAARRPLGGQPYMEIHSSWWAARGTTMAPAGSYMRTGTGPWQEILYTEALRTVQGS